MVTREELQDDNEYVEIRDDVREECSQYGSVLSVVMPRVKDGFSAAEECSIFVEFEAATMAAQARQALTGRKFAERVVVCEFYDESKFHLKIFT